MGKNMKLCLYCGQHIKNSEIGLYHEKCREIYYLKAERAMVSSDAFPEITVYKNGAIKRIKICRVCKIIVTDREIFEVESYLKAKKIDDSPKACMKCTKVGRR